MSAPLIQRLADGFGVEAESELRVRIFRLISAMTAMLCLFVVAPLNGFQNLPLAVHVANIVLGLMGALCYWQSCAGRHFIALFLVVLVGLLDVVWFWNAGSDGSVTHYFYPVMLFVIAMFQGPQRRVLTVGLWLNVSLLFIAEHYFPGWVTPFMGAADRLLDLETGVFCSFLALGSVTWFILTSYNREQRRVSVALEALRLNEERLRLAMEASHQGWFELNIQTGESVSSPEYVRILEYEPEEFHSNLQAWMGRIHPADREATLLTYQQGVQTGKPGVMEYRLRTKSGTWKWIRTVAKVVDYDGAGRALRVMGTHTDITERKELESQLLHSQRLEAVGTLASGVAHDLNNILTPMLMASGLLRDKLPDAKDRELMSMLDDGGRRGAAIVRQLLAFSRNLAQDRVPLDPRHLLHEMAQLMRSSFPKEIRVVEPAAGAPGLLEAEPNQLHQVIMNLCVNARDAMMPAGGTITLGLERVEIPPMAGTTTGGPHLVLSVADTGHGIPPELMERIFDPFFTTKPVGKGTGLGLASVHGIVKAHHGFVRVESSPGKGTIFRVFLPARAGLAAVAPPATVPPVTTASAPAQSAPAVPTTSILVVDDDRAVLMVTGRFLQRMGYRVIPAAGGKEALAALQQHREEVALVITDFSMPDMDGPALAPRLHEIKPGLRIIGASGLNHDHRAGELAALGFCEVLAKPYEWDDLLRAVRRQQAVTPT